MERGGFSRAISHLLRRGSSQRLALLDDVGRDEFGGACSAVRRVVHRSRGNEKRLARSQRRVRLAFTLEQNRPFDDVADFLAGMRVPARRPARLEFDERRDGLTSGRRDVGLLQNGSLEGRLLSERHGGQTDGARGQSDDCCSVHGSDHTPRSRCRFHAEARRLRSAAHRIAVDCRFVTLPASVDAVVIGGGPAGAAAGRLLAAWGHSVAILDHPSPRARGLAESIPPSTHKLMAEIGLLDAVERAGFLRGRGNTVWWASANPRIESFGPPSLATQSASFRLRASSVSAGQVGAASPREAPVRGLGYQVFRPDFDRVLLDSAASAGARVQTNARVRYVAFADQHATVDYDQEGLASRIEARFVLDCSGRAGVVARRFRRVQPGHRTYALVGVWERNRWDLPDDTHTVVETFDDGWAWSVPISATVRHVGVMVGQGAPYRAAVEKSAALRQRLDGATLRHDWACDASLYYSDAYAGSPYFLVGDAGSFIDPLSSFGVKKALASAWLAAVAAHTSLLDSGRQTVAREFFANWERSVYTTHLRRSRDFARAALAEHPSAFWAARADVEIPAPSDDEDAIPVGSARFGTTSPLALRYADEVRFEDRPVIRGREIVLEKAFAGGIRFAHHVDLVTLAEIACQSNRLPDLFEKYCQRCAPVPLPNLIGGLSLLVARGILYDVA